MIGRKYLARLVADLEAGRCPPDAVRRWLIDGRRRWENEPDTSLEAALGLIRTKDAITLRDAALAEALRAMPDGWKVSDRIRAVRKAESTMKPYVDEPELFSFRNKPPWYVAICEAMRNAPLPAKDRQLHAICSRTVDCKNSEGQSSTSKIEAEERG